MTYGDDGVTIVPTLAEKYDTSPDGMKFTFTLHDSVKFSNGRVITTDDVKDSFERLLDPKTPSPSAFIFDMITGVQDFTNGKATSVSGTKVIDPKTVEFDLHHPE